MLLRMKSFVVHGLVGRTYFVLDGPLAENLLPDRVGYFQGLRLRYLRK